MFGLKIFKLDIDHEFDFFGNNNISLVLAPHLASGLSENTNESEKESKPEEGDQWTPVTHKREQSLPSMPRQTIKTHNPAYRTSNVAVFAPVGADRADIENAAQRNDFFDAFLKRMITATMEIGSATYLMSQLFGIVVWH